MLHSLTPVASVCLYRMDWSRGEDKKVTPHKGFEPLELGQ